MSYALLRTDTFNDQLNGIILYIADDSGSADTALSALDKIEESILRLRDCPESGSLPHYAILRRQGFRVLIESRWLVFYKIDRNAHTVTLYAITDQRQEYLNLV